MVYFPDTGRDRGMVHPRIKFNRIQREVPKTHNIHVLIRYVISGEFQEHKLSGGDVSYLSKTNCCTLIIGDSDIKSPWISYNKWCIVNIKST